MEGRLVRGIENGTQPAGAFTTRWDGRDGSGRRVSSGVYFLRLSTGMGSVSERLILIR